MDLYLPIADTHSCRHRAQALAFSADQAPARNGAFQVFTNHGAPPGVPMS
jgi:hypothetical protein